MQPLYLVVPVVMGDGGCGGYEDQAPRPGDLPLFDVVPEFPGFSRDGSKGRLHGPGLNYPAGMEGFLPKIREKPWEGQG